MRPASPRPVSSKSLLLAIIFIFHTLAAEQNLPALTDSAAGIKSATSATSAASSPSPSKTATISASTASTKDASTKDASTTSKPTKTSSDTASPESDLPALTSSGSDGLLTGLPKLPGDDYPPPTVPPTANAPFMQKSNLPEGTVFICVGAALGFMALLVITWRGMVAWALHRSVRRAALAQSEKYNGGGRGIKVAQVSHRSSRAPFYSPGPGSTLSLEHLSASGPAGPKSAPARESLFFSPTAGGGMQNQGTRGSSYFPAGYYAAGNSAAGGGAGLSHAPGEGSTSFSNMAHPGHRYSRARSSMGPSPPGSPSLPPSRGADVGTGFRRLSTADRVTMQGSNSTLNLTAPSQTRAPSAYLEDLFENHRPGT
ncbi:hypothetical protein MMC07_002695 [Pseudocyphellaria aurata]|nr:hypothetical protein [Pseudocyphellaria aurata]